MEYLNLLVDTKKEFTSYLISYLYPEINKGIDSIYLYCKKNSMDNKTDILFLFQKMLLEIPKWNKNVVYKETNRIKQNISYLDDLLTAVFISNVRLLCSIKSSQKKIKLKIPKLEIFIHKCYIQCARDFYETLYLFDENNNKLTIQKNKKKIQYSIKHAIEIVIRDFLPIKSILSDYLESNLSDNNEPIINDELINIINENNENKEHNEDNENKQNNNEDNLSSNNESLDKNINENLENCDNNLNINNIVIESNEINPLEEIVDNPNILYTQCNNSNNLEEKLIKLNTN